MKNLLNKIPRAIVPLLTLAALIGGIGASVAFADRTPVNGGSGSQTPWTTNIDGGGNNLSNVGTISAGTVAATSAATSTLANQDGTLVATSFSGADIGAKIDAAYAALPANGGTIKVPSGTYSFSTQISFQTAGKPVSLVCDPGGNTTLSYTGGATSTVVNFGQGTGYPSTGAGGQSISNCKYQGPGTTTPATAIELGGANGNKNFSLNNLEIVGFGTVAVATEANTYLETFTNDFVHHNIKDFSFQSSSNAGENIRFIGGTWADCSQSPLKCIDFSTTGAADVLFNGVSFDDAQVHIGAITRNVVFLGGHFENPAADNIAQYTPLLIDSSANTNVTISGTNFTNGANTNRAAQDISNGAQLTVNSATTEDYGGGTKGVADFVTNTGNGWTKIESITKQDSAYATLWNSTGGTGTIQYSQEDNGNLGIGTSSAPSLVTISTSTSPNTTSLFNVASSTGASLFSVFGGSIGMNSVVSDTPVLGSTLGAATNVEAITIAPISDGIPRWGIRLTSGGKDLSFDYRDSGGSPQQLLYLQRANGTVPGSVGVATSTPWGVLSVNPTATAGTAPSFVIGSSTGTKFIVASTGNVGIATTSPWRTFSVNGTMTLIGETTSTAGNAVCVLTTGDVVTAGAVTCATSSKYTKYDVRTMSGAEAMKEILALQPVLFKYNDGNQMDHTGVIAEQAALVAPGIVDYATATTTLDGHTFLPGDPISVDPIAEAGLLFAGEQYEQTEILAKNSIPLYVFVAFGVMFIWNCWLTMRPRK